MKYRKLRITWSVVWGLLAVLLCVLWVRSYWWTGQESKTIGYFESIDRVVGIVWGIRGAGVLFAKLIANAPPRISEFGLPYWASLPLLSAIAAVPWLRWRFSLRTLLITTTLVAVVLGLVVWLR